MSPEARLRELLLGIEGMALLRRFHEADGDAVSRRIAEIGSLVEDEALAEGEPIHELAPAEGYGQWAPTYDQPGNPIIALEQPAVWSLLEPLAAGQALDAACGTGRHARRLISLGHEVTGVDLTPEMLERASANVPQARFSLGDICALPAPDESFDLAVCGLALAHLPHLSPAIVELARVLKPGGRLVISIIHPILVHLGWQARFASSQGDGKWSFIREHPHPHADYVVALSAAGMQVRQCLEPVLTTDHLPAMRRVFDRIPEATRDAYDGLPGVLVWLAEKQPPYAR